MSHAPNDDAPMGDDLPDDLAAAPEPDSSGSRSVGRRTFLRGATVGAGSLAAGGFSIRYSTREAEAIAPVVLAGAAAGAVAVGWALREYEVVGRDDPSTGLSADALLNEVHNAAQTRKSTNASTFIDNQNLIDSGLPETLYSEGKIAAINALNAEKTQSEVEAAAITAMEAHLATIETNFLKSWKESHAEFEGLYTAVDGHSDISDPTLIFYTSLSDDYFVFDTTKDVTLADGTVFTIPRMDIQSNAGSYNNTWDPTGKSISTDPYIDVRTSESDSTTVVQYLNADDWNAVWTAFQNVKTSVNDGLITWVSNIYSEVQAGDLDTSELLTPSELASMTTDNSEFNQAVADLSALNIKSDLDSRVVVNPSNVDAEISGSLSSTGEVTFTAGDTVDPSADSHSYYFTYDTAAASGDWVDYQPGIDGGVITFTAEPLDATEYTVTTNNDETVAVMTDDLVDQGDGTWTYDASADLDNDISEISSVEFGASGSETNFVTVQLTSPFTVVSITNDAGDSVDSTAVTSPEPHNDSNYITQEEWDDREQRHQELIEKYEQSQGGGGGFVDGLGFGGLPGEGVLVGIIGIVVVLLGQSD